MKYASIVLLAAALTPSFAKERDRCPFETPQQLAALQAVDQKIGGKLEARNVVLGLKICTDAGNTQAPCGPVVNQSDIDAKRLALANTEVWAMSLTDTQLKTDYLCAIMVDRRSLDEAALEIIDHHLQKQMDAVSKPIATPQ